MNQEQREQLIARMLDDPTSLSTTDIEQIEADAELRELYEVSAELRRACAEPPRVDAEAEWALLRPRLRRRPSRLRWVMRVAAIFLGVTLASSVLVRVIDGTLDRPSPRTMAAGDTAALTAPSTPAPAAVAVAAEAEAVAPVIAEESAPAPKAAKPAAAEPDFDLDAYMRLERARIDNEIAMLTAATIEEAYETRRRCEAEMGIAVDDDPEASRALMRVTLL